MMLRLLLSFPLLILLLFFGVFVFVIVHSIIISIKNAKYNSRANEVLASVNSFNVTEKHLSGAFGDLIAHDALDKKFCFVSNCIPYVYDYKDIKKASLLIDGETINEIHSSPLTSDETEIKSNHTAQKSLDEDEKRVKRIDIQVATNDNQSDIEGEKIFTINFQKDDVREDSFIFKLNYKKSKKWLEIIYKSIL